MLSKCVHVQLLPAHYSCIILNKKILYIIVEDEFTFFAEGNPLVQDSTVTLRNQVDNYYNRSQITNGSILFNDIYEGLYEIYVDSQVCRPSSE